MAKKIAQAMSQDQEKLIQVGTVDAIKFLRPALQKSISAFRKGRKPTTPIKDRMDELIDQIATAMAVSHMSGIARIRSIAPVSLSFADAKRFLRKRAKISVAKFKTLRARYSVEVLKILPAASAAVSASIEAAVVRIISQELHVTEGVKQLKRAFNSAGITSMRPYAVETIYRTQIQIAYSAGKYTQEQDPDIQEILWGYEYSTVGDDRVRDEHVDFDGVVLPKDDSFWDTAFPPNGFSCRCQVVPIFEKQKSKQPGANAMIAKGFNFNPGKLLDDF